MYHFASSANAMPCIYRIYGGNIYNFIELASSVRKLLHAAACKRSNVRILWGRSLQSVVMEYTEDNSSFPPWWEKTPCFSYVCGLCIQDSGLLMCKNGPQEDRTLWSTAQWM